VIVPFVHVTAPPPAGAALKTAKADAEPSAGAVAVAAWAAIGHTPASKARPAIPMNRVLKSMLLTLFRFSLQRSGTATGG